MKEQKRCENQLLRTLKLACSMDHVAPRVIIGNSLVRVYESLISFREGQTTKVISYSSNLVMNQDDFYEIFKYQEINVLDKVDLYNIHWIMKQFNSWKYGYEYLTFTREILKELSMKEWFSFLSEKYNSVGIHYRNIFLFDGGCDTIFFQEEDTRNNKYDKFIEELRDFTKAEAKDSKYISYCSKKDNYRLKVNLFQSFRFSLLSDKTVDEEWKAKLLSNKRYHKCHENAIKVANSLDKESKKSTYVVGGKCKINEIDYYYHSWVEIEEENMVIDFNNNIVMDKNQYYQLFEAKPIHRTRIPDMNNAIQTIVYGADINLHPLYLNYFGTDIMRDLQKNKKILLKK